MKLKTLVLTVALLAALSVVAWFLQRPPALPAADPRVGQPVLDARTLDRTDRIRLSDQGKTVLLTKQTGGRWIDASYYDLPADFSKLSRFTDDLASAKVQRLVSRNPAVLARLNFKDTTVALLDAAGKELWRLTLGKEAERGGRFVKFDDEPKGYLANLSTFLDAEPKNWADSLLVDLKPDDIASVEVGFDQGEPVTATRAKKEDPWKAAAEPAGQRIDEAKITSLLSSLTSLRFQDTSDLADPTAAAARQHSRTVKFTTFDHQTITIQLGRKPEEKKETGERKPETGKPAAPKLAAEGGKPEAGSQKPEAGAGPAAASASTAPNPEAAPATTPAGPVYAFIASSDPAAPVNALMTKRAFQVYEWNYTSLPAKAGDLFEPVPAPAPVVKQPQAAPAAAPSEAIPAAAPKP